MMITVCIVLLGTNSLFSNQNETKNDVSISMLHHLATETNLVIQSKGSNNRLYLDKIYDSIINNYDPSRINETTQRYVTQLLTQIENLRVIAIQRDRMEMIFDSKRAQALKSAVPSPLSVVGLSYMIRDPLKLMINLGAMAATSMINYSSSIENTNLEFLQQGWELDDSENAQIHALNMQIFNYTIDVTREGRLKKSDTLSQKAISDFVAYKLDQTIPRRLASLKGGSELYKTYPAYWLELANTYYEVEQYSACLDAISEYETLVSGDEIFRQDLAYGQTLTRGIVAASYVFEGSPEYEEVIRSFIEKTYENTSNDDWAQKQFCSIACLGLATDESPNKQEYLDAAYQILISNAIVLSKKQENDLRIYIKEIPKLSKPEEKNLTDNRKKEVKDTIKQLEKLRNNELPPMNAGYLLTINALFDLMDVRPFSDEEIKELNDIMGASIIVPQLRHALYDERYSDEGISLEKGSFPWSSYTLTLPAKYLLSDSIIEKMILSEDLEFQRIKAYEVASVNRKDSSLNGYSAEVKFKIDQNSKSKGNKAVALKVISGGVPCYLYFSPAKGSKFNFFLIE